MLLCYRLQDFYPSQQNSLQPNKIKKKQRYITPEQREKRNKKRRIHPLPRILKRDIRRLYPTIFINMFNSVFNEELLKQYVNTYYSPTLNIEKLLLHDIRSDLIRYHYDIQGPQVMYQFFQAYSLYMPDFVVHLINSQSYFDIHTNSCMIILRLQVKGTLMKYRSKNDFEQLIQRNQRNYQLLTTLSTLELRQVQENYNHTIQSFVSNREMKHSIEETTCTTYLQDPMSSYLLPKPTPSILNTYLIMKINSENKIDRFEILHLDTTIALGSLSLTN